MLYLAVSLWKLENPGITKLIELQLQVISLSVISICDGSAPVLKGGVRRLSRTPIWTSSETEAEQAQYT